MASKFLNPSKWRNNKNEKDDKNIDANTLANQSIGTSIATVQSLISPYYRVSGDHGGSKAVSEVQQEPVDSRKMRFSWIGRQKEQTPPNDPKTQTQYDGPPAGTTGAGTIKRKAVESSAGKGSTISENVLAPSQTTYIEPDKSLDQIDLQRLRSHQQSALSAIDKSEWKEAENHLSKVVGVLSQTREITVQAEWLLKLIEVQSYQRKWSEAYQTGNSIDLQAVTSLRLVTAIRFAMAQAARNDGKKDLAKSQCAKIITTCRSEVELRYYLEQAIICMSSILESEGKEDEAQIYLSLLPHSLHPEDSSNEIVTTTQINQQADTLSGGQRQNSMNVSILSSQDSVAQSRRASQKEIRRKPVGNTPSIPARSVNRTSIESTDVTSLSRIVQEVIKSTEEYESDDTNEDSDGSNYENSYFSDQDSRDDKSQVLPTERQNSTSKLLAEHHEDIKSSVDYTPINPYQSHILPENLIPPHEKYSSNVRNSGANQINDSQRAVGQLQIEPFEAEKLRQRDFDHKLRNFHVPALTQLQTLTPPNTSNKDKELLSPAGLEVYVPEQHALSGLEVYTKPHVQREALKEVHNPAVYYGRPGYGGLEVAYDMAPQAITSADVSYSDKIHLPTDSNLLAQWNLSRAYDGVTIVGSKEHIWKAIMDAIIGPDQERLSYLLFRDPQMTEHRDKENYGALHWAAFHGNHHATHYLTTSGANVNMKTDNHWTPLHWACLKGHHAVAETLLRYGADPNSQVQNGSSAMHWAAQNGHFYIVALLLEFGANPNMLTFASYTPLHSASQHGQDVVARVLLDWRADVNPVSENGSTPLHCAVQGGHIEVARVLLNSGANISARTLRGKTPRKMAKNKEMISFLQSYRPVRVIQ